MRVVKKKIYGHILSVNVAPLKDQDRDTMYNMILEEASFDIFGTACMPVSLSTNCINLAWTVRSAFRKYADQSVDRLFDLWPPLRGSQDTVAYRAGRVQALLSLEHYGYFHKVLDMVRELLSSK